MKENHHNYEKRTIARFTAYLKLIAEHARIDMLRQHKRYENNILCDFSLVEPFTDFDNVYTAERSQQVTFEFEEERISKAFAQLGAMRKKVLELTFINELSSSEIAEEIGCSEAYVRKIRQRAIANFKKILNEGNEQV